MVGIKRIFAGDERASLWGRHIPTDIWFIYHFLNQGHVSSGAVKSGLMFGTAHRPVLRQKFRLCGSSDADPFGPWGSHI